MVMRKLPTPTSEGLKAGNFKTLGNMPKPTRKIVMIISFTELAIDSRQFNGVKSSLAKALIINKACDYIMHYLYPHYQEENIVPHADLAIVDFSANTVELPVTLHPEYH